MNPLATFAAMNEALHTGELAVARELALDIRLCLDHTMHIPPEIPAAEMRRSAEQIVRRLEHLP
jgi:hypothetical protein